MRFSNAYDCLAPIHQTYILRNFVGEYKDYYNNHIIAKSPVTVELKGSGANISIGAGVYSFKEQLRFIALNEVTLNIGKRLYTNHEKVIVSTLYDGARTAIGDNVCFGNNVNIRSSFFTSTYIGDNCYIGNDAVIFNGDGHAILSIDTGENLNYDLNNSSESKHIITIGDNSQIGNDCFILSGSYIANGSIVRDKSLTNKNFGERALIAGHPAHVIKNIQH